MGLVLATLVNVEELLASVAASIVAALVLAITVSLGIWGTTRYVDLNLEGRGAAAYGALAIGGAGILATVALIAFGLFLLVSG